jgi:hypothetical protein
MVILHGLIIFPLLSLQVQTEGDAEERKMKRAKLMDSELKTGPDTVLHMTISKGQERVALQLLNAVPMKYNIAALDPVIEKNMKTYK